MREHGYSRNKRTLGRVTARLQPPAKPSGCGNLGPLLVSNSPTSRVSGHVNLMHSEGIILAYADTSLVWATHETIASRFDCLQSASWMMTSFTIGYFVTLPMVSLWPIPYLLPNLPLAGILISVSQYKRLCDNLGSLRSLLVAYSTFCVGSALWYVVFLPCS